MRNILGIGTALVACFGCVAPVASQTAAYNDAPTPDAAPCRDIAGQAEIDGEMQQIVGRACLQPDGTWRIVQDSGAVVVAPAPAYPYYVPAYPYYGPWYWGPPVVVGVGASFIFVDRFHHFHHLDHVRFGRPDRGLPGFGGFGGSGGMRGFGGVRGSSGMSGGMSGGGIRRH